MDVDDVAQILRIHIFKKWHLYDQTKKLTPWINRIISNQIKNLIRNNYGNYVRPCVKCAAAEGEDLCAIYKKQSAECPLFKNWYKNKKSAYDTILKRLSLYKIKCRLIWSQPHKSTTNK